MTEYLNSNLIVLREREYLVKYVLGIYIKKRKEKNIEKEKLLYIKLSMLHIVILTIFVHLWRKYVLTERNILIFLIIKNRVGKDTAKIIR